MGDVLHRRSGLRESYTLIDSEDERRFSVLVMHMDFKALSFDFEFNVQEHSNRNFMKDMLLYHENLQLEYQNEQV